MKNAKEVRKIARKVITDKMTELQNICVKRIEDIIISEASRGAFFCYISKSKHPDEFEYMCNGDIREIIAAEGYKITPIQGLDGITYLYKIDW